VYPIGAFDINAYGGDGPDLPGDTNTGKKFEWTDGGQRSHFPSHVVHRWSSENDTRVLFIYESDSDCIGTLCVQRDEDCMFAALVHRRDLLPFGKRRVFASPCAAAQDAIQNAEARAEYQAWIKREEVVKAIDEARSSGALKADQLPRMVVSVETTK
jgi:hypothetical protein